MIKKILWKWPGEHAASGTFKKLQAKIALGKVVTSTSYSWEDRGRYGWLSLRIERAGVQVKLWNPLRTRAIPESFCGGFTYRCYINTFIYVDRDQHVTTTPKFHTGRQSRRRDTDRHKERKTNNGTNTQTGLLDSCWTICSATFGMLSLRADIALKTLGMCPSWGTWSNMAGWAMKNATIPAVTISSSSTWSINVTR